jgi:SAM-dependent methyltransferase
MSDRHGGAAAEAWQPLLYDTKLGFNARYGGDLVEVLAPRAGERILDLGCGTGHLTWRIAEHGAFVVGLDHSVEMVKRARALHPGLPLVVADGQGFAFIDQTFDAVFSNAAIHWMENAVAVARCVRDALKPGGRFVAELGGKGNLARLIDGVRMVREEADLPVTHLPPWYFPSLGEYASLLEGQGFRVVLAAQFDRPTSLDDGDRGLGNWLSGFGSRLLGDVPEPERANLMRRVEERLRPVLYHDGAWTLDYVRLRIVAVRPGGVASVQRTLATRDR